MVEEMVFSIKYTCLASMTRQIRCLETSSAAMLSMHLSRSCSSGNQKVCTSSGRRESTSRLGSKTRSSLKSEVVSSELMNSSTCTPMKKFKRLEEMQMLVLDSETNWESRKLLLLWASRDLNKVQSEVHREQDPTLDYTAKQQGSLLVEEAYWKCRMGMVALPFINK